MEESTGSPSARTATAVSAAPAATPTRGGGAAGRTAPSEGGAAAVAGDAADGTQGAGLPQHAREAQDYLRRLLGWRRTASAVHGGTLTQFAPEDGTYVYFRRDSRQVLMVAFNKADAERRLDPARFAQSRGERHRQSALRAVGAARLGRRNAVGNDNQPTHRAELQGRESKPAQLINPTSE